MPQIKVTVTNKKARLLSGFVVNGNSDYVVKFIFDKEWREASAKTARFVYGANEYTDVPFVGDECPMPILKDVSQVSIGVYAGNLRTTTPAVIETDKCILDGSPIHVDPPEDVYNQILQLIEEGAIKGEKGDKGDRGERGERGEKGEDGHVSDDQIDEIADIVEQRVNVPTKTSDLTNDSGFITDEELVAQGFAKLAELATVATSGKYTDLTDRPTIPSIEGLASTTYVDTAISTALGDIESLLQGV